jgi:thioredoxin 1
MKTKKISVVILIVLAGLLISCGKSETKGNNNTAGKKDTKVTTDYKIEFVELGSVNCIPCKKMQPVMASIEKKYAGQVKVTFHDVWKDDAPAKKYGIDLIPTQVFLDAGGKELMRHQGFFPEEDIDKFLQSQGLNISN